MIPWQLKAADNMGFDAIATAMTDSVGLSKALSERLEFCIAISQPSIASTTNQLPPHVSPNCTVPS